MNLHGVLRWFVLGTMFLAVACTGGPISDFPTKAHSGDGDNDNPSTGGTDAGAMAPPAHGGDGDLSSGDGDVGGDGDATGGDGDSTPALDGGLSPGDAGAVDGGTRGDGGPMQGDAGPDAGVDAGPVACTSTSDGQPDACYGYYCHTTSAELASGAMVGGACNDAADLALVCDGSIPRAVASCTASNGVSPSIGQAIHDCAKNDSDTSLKTATDACVQCYVDESVCMIQFCLGPCLAAQADKCNACRISQCSDALYACTGLPKP